jgi:hypothetical protein
MLLLFTLIVMGIVAFFQYRNGLFTSVTMTIQVVLAGIIAFMLWEPVADEIDPALVGGRFAGFEDCVAMVGLFCASVFGMRLLTNRLNKDMIDFHPMVQQIGGPAAGLLTGYLLAGFLICVFETLPLEENFLGFAPRKENEPSLRSYLPPDRVWLALMRQVGAYSLWWKETEEPPPEPASVYDRSTTFDRDGTFELRYSRFRRHGPSGRPDYYTGEFRHELGRDKQ